MIQARKLKTGNYFGYYKGYYFFIYRRPHGKWCCIVGKNGEWLFSEGYHGTSLPTVAIAKRWADIKINFDIEILLTPNL